MTWLEFLDFLLKTKMTDIMQFNDVNKEDQSTPFIDIIWLCFNSVKISRLIDFLFIPIYF